MISIELTRVRDVLNNKKELETKLNAKIRLNGKNVVIEADPFDEFEAQRVFDAINMGFSVKKALKVIDEDTDFIKINIKDYANTNNRSVVRSRLIGTNGKTRKTIEEITGCNIVVHENSVGIIGPAEISESALVAVTNIIKGTKQSNAYRYLEKINTQRKQK